MPPANSAPLRSPSQIGEGELSASAIARAALADAQTPDELQAAEFALETAAAAEKAALSARREWLNLHEHPVHRLIERRRLTHEQIAKVERVRAKYATEAEIFEGRLNDAIGRVDDWQLDGLPNLLAAFSREAAAERLVAGIDRWLKTTRDGLPALDAQIIATASAKGLQRLIPDALRPKSAA